jgi:gas vesicle protein
MPVTFVRDPVTGITYSVNISGSTPTEQESARINQFLASQRTLSVLPQAQPVEEEEIDRTAFGRGFVREPFQRERSFGVVEEALADTAFGKFFGFDAEEARAKQEAAEAELRRLELEDPSIRFEDITGLGTAASVSGEALGGEARDIAIQAGATATGAGIGGLFFGAGAVPGAAIGRTAGVAYTTAQAAPQMLAEAIEAQKEEGNEVNLTKALGATAINLLSEFVTDYFVVGKLIPKEAKSKVGSAVRSAIEAGTAEGATEVFQQAVIRGQAGQDLTSPEAIAEYAESLYSGMTVGGTIGGVGGFLSTPDRSAEKELDDDLKELREYGLAGFKFAEETEKDIEAQRKAALGAVGIDLDAPLQIGTDGAPLALPAPDAAEIAPKPVIADTEFENLSFNKAEYERVLQQVKADITRRKPQPEQAEVDVPSSEPLSKPVSNPINIPAIHQRVKADIPGITVSKVRDIMKELQARGFVAENPASKKNKFIPMGSLTPEVKTPDVSYRRQIDSAADFIKADQTRLERLKYDLRSAEAYGRDLEGNRVTPNQVNATIARVEQRIAQNQQRIELANQRLQSLGQDTHVPRIEKVGIPPSLKAVPVAEGTPDALRPRFEAQQAGIRGMKEQVSSLNKQVRKLNEQAKKRTLSSNELDRMQKLQQQQAELSKRLGEAQANLKAPEKIVQEAKGEQFREQERQREIERKLAAARARAAADQVKAQEDQGVSPVTPAFNAKQAKVFDALKKRLTNLGLKDVKLEGVQKIEGGEGFFDPVTKTITLAMGMYDPNMNDQQLFDAISEVMNHEVIHALRAMGVLKPNEMKVLERLAEKTKYVKRTKDGTQKRNYTYLDRAKSLYSDYTPTQQKEEAIAEMFRDYVAGRLKLGGGPRALFEKIKKFFKSLIGANVDNGFNSVEDIFQGIRRGEIGARDRVAPAAQTAAAAPSQVMLSRLPTLPMAPDGTRAHQLPSQLLMRGTGAAPLVNMTQKYTPGNAAANNAAIQQILDQYPNAMSSEREWAEAMQASFGGDFIPVPPMVGLQYAQSPEKMAEKLRKLTPELKKGVDKGFEYVKKIRDVYNSGNASPRMTLKLFIWGILSRGAGPVQQESAFIDIIDNAYPIIQKATRQPLTEDDIDMWMTTVSRSIPEGSPGKQVTMNVNAAANLVRAMSQLMPGSNQTVLGAVHDAMSDPNANPADIRQFFLSNTQGAGIDNKVLSFILLVGGKDDVLVMDRIQGRHLWDDGRFGGANIYDGIGKQKAGLNGIFRGPYGILTTRILENGLRQNVSRAYELIGRPEDASLGRFHWETWVIEGEQVVSHDTLAAVFNDSSIGQSVTEGKTDTLSSGMTYRRGEVSTVVEYPLSNGDVVYMKPDRFKEFTTALADDAKKAKSSTGVFKEGKFKVTARADIPWFDRPDVDRGALDTMAREYENARPDGSVLVGTERAREGQDASQRGNSDLDKRYSRLPTDEVRPERGGDKRDGRPARSLAPLEGGPIVEGATGPDEELVSVAEKYARDNGIDLRRQAEFVKVDEARAKRIADAYEAMEDRPQDPEVREAYDNLIRQTRAQYDALVDAGYEFTFFDKETDPYSGDPWAAMIDLRNNKRMAVYGTYAGYGSEGMPATAAAGNPLLQDTGLRWPDQRGVEQIVTPNDLFRAVHDAFGHSIEGAGFRARGEENAWQAHVRLFTGSAIPALTSETRGQNSWLNYGPFGEKNRTASVEDTIFAPQKIGLMPSFTWTEGRAGDGNLDSGSGMTDAEADAILRWFTGLDAGNTAAVRALDAATRKIVEDTNNVRVESGLIPSEFDQVLDEDGDVIERPNYNFYVPLRGIVDPEAAESDGTAARAGSGQRFGGKGRPDPRALGRYKYATDVLATLINQNQQSVSRGERNKVGQSFLQLLRADPATTKAYAEILPRTPTRRALVGKRVREITDFNAAQRPEHFCCQRRRQGCVCRTV